MFQSNRVTRVIETFGDVVGALRLGRRTSKQKTSALIFGQMRATIERGSPSLTGRTGKMWTSGHYSKLVFILFERDPHQLAARADPGFIEQLLHGSLN